MRSKLRQVADNVHGTIYLSELESELISTPYFYRLHDIYQSSTVYLTFPSNRTKRYEHSLGTMALASEMFFSAITNADLAVRKGFLQNLYCYYKELSAMIINGSFEDSAADYMRRVSDTIKKWANSSEYQENPDLDNTLKQIIAEAMRRTDIFSDFALDHFQYNLHSNKNNIEEISDMDSTHQELFIYRCILQAIRIVALFHDIGHPPYSHIIETVLNEIYNECHSADSANRFDGTKVKVLDNSLGRFLGQEQKEFRFILTKAKAQSPDLHEQVGMHMFEHAISDVIDSIVQRISRNEIHTYDIVNILYYITIFEFSAAILLEKDEFFKWIHRIVDGVVDADRLDYIVRDSQNAGVDWGRIPYKRLIDSIKLVKPIKEKDCYSIAFSQKEASDIEDALLTRYKIFARINFHHRCNKTAIALQNAVKWLARDFLSHSKVKGQDQSICPDIENLWSALGSTVGKKELKVLQWNDSWLVSILQKTLLTLSGKEDSRSRLEKLGYKREDLDILQENLDEFLLNRKIYYSLFKRGSDIAQFIKDTFEYTNITKEVLLLLQSDEMKSLASEKSERKTSDVLDSLRRIKCLDDTMNSGDLECLNHLISTQAIAIIEDVLKKYMKASKVVSYALIENPARNKTGLPNHNDESKEIYLYSGESVFSYDETQFLEPQIQAVRRSCLSHYIYIVPSDAHHANELLMDIRKDCIQAVGDCIITEFCSLFPAHFGANTG